MILKALVYMLCTLCWKAVLILPCWISLLVYADCLTCNKPEDQCECHKSLVLFDPTLPIHQEDSRRFAQPVDDPNPSINDITIGGECMFIPDRHKVITIEEEESGRRLDFRFDLGWEENVVGPARLVSSVRSSKYITENLLTQPQDPLKALFPGSGNSLNTLQLTASKADDTDLNTLKDAFQQAFPSSLSVSTISAETDDFAWLTNVSALPDTLSKHGIFGIINNKGYDITVLETTDGNPSFSCLQIRRLLMNHSAVLLVRNAVLYVLQPIPDSRFLVVRFFPENPEEQLIRYGPQQNLNSIPFGDFFNIALYLLKKKP